MSRHRAHERAAAAPLLSSLHDVDRLEFPEKPLLPQPVAALGAAARKTHRPLRPQIPAERSRRSPARQGSPAKVWRARRCRVSRAPRGETVRRRIRAKRRREFARSSRRPAWSRRGSAARSSAPPAPGPRRFLGPLPAPAHPCYLARHGSRPAFLAACPRGRSRRRKARRARLRTGTLRAHRLPAARGRSPPITRSPSSRASARCSSAPTA